MSQSNAKLPEQKNDKTGRDIGITLAIISGLVTVLVAVFGCLGTITAPGIQPFANWLFNRTPVPTSTDISPTATPVRGADPVTDTQDLSCTQNQNCPTSVDWANNCIAGYNWTVYSSSDFPQVPKDENECYSQPILDAFYTKDDGLYIFAQPRSLISSKDYGLFTPLPQSGKVSVTLDLDKMDNGQVWIGIFEEPDIDSKGVLLVAPPGDVRRQAFALKTMPSEGKIEVSRVFENSLGKYTLGFKLEYGSIIANVEGTSMTAMPFTSRTRWLYIGYRAKLYDPLDGTADIQALFTDLKIEE